LTAGRKISSDLPHQHAYDKLAIDVPGPETERIGKNIAKKYGTYVIFTAKAKWPEVIKNRVFNTAILINPDGEVILKHAKNIVGTFETSTTPHDVYDAWVKSFGDGLDAFFQVADTDIGKIGSLICWEGRGGGFILSSGCFVPIDAKFENVKAMVDTAKNHAPANN
jgi:predicted amidohydrolase